MNKNTFMAAMFAASTALVGCTNDESVSSRETDVISFNIINGGGTRATPTTPSNYLSQVAGFQVWGYYAASATGTGVVPGGRYVGADDTHGVFIDGNGGSWGYRTASDASYWPTETAPLNFQAITPATDASFTIENTVSNKLAHVVANVTVPTDNALQRDIMFASTANLTSAGGRVVNLSFQHAMSQITFSAKTVKSTMTAEIGEITLCNVCNTGKVGYLSSADTDGVVKLSHSTSTSTVASYSVGLVSDKSVTSTSKNMTADNGVLLMLPQTTTAWNTSSSITSANANRNTYIKVSCKILDKGVYLVGTSSSYATIYVPFAASWQQGKKYTYTLVIGGGSGGYDENGNAQLVPVSFTVSAADWTAVDGGTVPSDPYNGHAYVDLGLPSGLLWATCNVGADSPEQAGLYFAWGETVGYTAAQVIGGERAFDWDTYKAGSAASISADLTLSQDAAHVNMGGSWRMPTQAECQELIDNCTYTWYDDYGGTGVAGRLFTSKTNGNSVFFPAAGNCYDSTVSHRGSDGYYWSASWGSASYAYDLHFNSWGVSTDFNGRIDGQSVRGVCE